MPGLVSTSPGLHVGGFGAGEVQVSPGLFLLYIGQSG